MSALFEWDGESPVAYCDGWPMPGVPYWASTRDPRLCDAWEVRFRCENGVELTMFCPHLSGENDCKDPTCSGQTGSAKPSPTFRSPPVHPLFKIED